MSSIREVAKKANVSVATVSRYLNSPEKVAKQSAHDVKEAIRQLNYKPNLLARNFFKSRSYAILVLVPNIANPFFSRVIRGIEDVGQQKGYAVLLGDTRFSKEREAEYFQRVETRQAEGVIQLSPNFPGELSSNNEHIPFVNACDCFSDAPYPTVQIDNEAATKTVVDYLISLGHERIGCVLSPDDNLHASPISKARLAGYQQALQSAGIEFDESLLVSGDFSLSSGLAAAPYFAQMERRPTAVFCMNDEMAIGLIQGLKAQGLKVPDDISVAGFDDIEFAKYCDPALTTIAQPAEEIGRAAMSVLYGLLEGRTDTKMKHTLPTELVIRESTAPPKKR
jgi:LacI family repressor for deo operon, udp, cdd, tsx, nupC, and nupG|tara:strand:+ start:8009 stop:9022 length:1014 start_codon:yes stop_codon:yes gene_type:complete